jgi:hypothetical protein
VELRRQLWAYVQTLNQQGVTVVLTTHYLEEAQELCDTIAIVNRGEVVACEPTSQLLRRLDSRTVVVTPEKPLDAIGGIQFQVPNGGHWDYRPGQNKAGVGFTNPTKPKFDNKQWSRIEILVDATKGTARMAVERTTANPRACRTSVVQIVIGRCKIPDALVHVGVDRMIRLRQVARVEQRLAHVLRVVVADGIGEDRQQVIDAHPRRLHQQRIVERGMHLTRVNQAPAIAKTIRVVAFHVKALVGAVLENRHGVVAPFDEEVDCFRAEQGCIEPVEENGPSAALGVADFAGKDRLVYNLKN